MEDYAREKLKHYRGKIARIHNGLGYFAVVELTIHYPTQHPAIVFDCHGAGWMSQGTIEGVPAEGYDNWKQGALVGIQYALKRCGNLPCHITVTSIQGLTTDTNPTIVGGAAIQALWKGLEYHPSTREMAFVERLVVDSFARPGDSIPDFGMLIDTC